MIRADLLAKRLRQENDTSLQCKRVLLAANRVHSPEQNGIANELASMANGKGGRLVLGIDGENRDVLGIPLDRLDAVEGWVREICNELVVPPLNADIYKVELPDDIGELRPVIEVVVPPSIFVHRGPGGYFSRIGDSMRELGPEALARLFLQRRHSNMIRFDEFSVPCSGPEDLDIELVRQLQRASAKSKRMDLGNMGVMANDEDGVPRLTVSGALLCTTNPATWLPNAMIQAVCYAGERPDINYQSDACEINGPLDGQVVAALQFVRRNASVGALQKTGPRELPQFSERAIFEALVNAVAHRDYSIHGAHIRLRMFSNRLELHVPGALAGTMTTESMPVRQFSRNQLVVSLLARCPLPAGENLGRTYLMDRRGDGVPIIEEETRKLSGRLPVYTMMDDNELRLVIWAASRQELGEQD